MTPSTLPIAFLRLSWANLAAQSAEQLSLAAVPIVAVLMLGAGAGEIGLLATLQTLPFLLLSIPLGLLADRVSRSRLMVWAEVLRTLALLGLLAAVLGGQLSIELLAALGFAGALGTVGFSVAAPALVPVLVRRDALARANARMELARSTAFAAGPALAGALVAWAGASAAFVLAAMLSGAAAVCLMGLREPVRPPALVRKPWQDLQEGAQLVWCHDMLKPILLTSVIWNISWFVLQAAYVPYAVRTLGMSASAVGFTLAAWGVGMVTGALLAGRLLAVLPFGRAIQVGPIASVVGSAVMAATLLVPAGSVHPELGALLAATAFFVFGAGPIVWTITSTTLRQTVTPPVMLGSVTAMFLTANMGARPVGAALGGLIGAHWGEAACLWVSLLGFVLQAAVIMWSPLSSLKKLPESEMPAGQ